MSIFCFIFLCLIAILILPYDDLIENSPEDFIQYLNFKLADRIRIIRKQKERGSFCSILSMFNLYTKFLDMPYFFQRAL